MLTLIEKDTTKPKPYYLISTLNFNLKAFDFFKSYFYTDCPDRGVIDMRVERDLFKTDEDILYSLLIRVC